MIGYQILAIERKNDFLCDEVGPISIELSMYDEWNNKKEAERIYNLFGKSASEFVLTLQELKDIAKAKTCIGSQENYHPRACDGIVVIPKTKDRFVMFENFKPTKL